MADQVLSGVEFSGKRKRKFLDNEDDDDASDYEEEGRVSYEQIMKKGKQPRSYHKKGT